MAKETKNIDSVDQLLSLDSAAIQNLSFEEGLKLLEKVVEEVEAGNLSLEKSVRLYEKGSALAEHLKNLLDQAETRIRSIKRTKESVIIKEIDPEDLNH